MAESGVSDEEDGEDSGCFAGEAAGVWLMVWPKIAQVSLVMMMSLCRMSNPSPVMNVTPHLMDEIVLVMM